MTDLPTKEVSQISLHTKINCKHYKQFSTADNKFINKIKTRHIINKIKNRCHKVKEILVLIREMRTFP